MPYAHGYRRAKAMSQGLAGNHFDSSDYIRFSDFFLYAFEQMEHNKHAEQQQQIKHIITSSDICK